MQNKKRTYFQPQEVICKNSYKVLEQIGQGAYGQVYKCCIIDQPGKLRAIKVFKVQDYEGNPLQFNLLLREIKIQKLLKHKNICELYEMNQDNEFYYLVQEYCNNVNLNDKIKQIGKKVEGAPFNLIDEQLAISYMQQIIEAFKYIHTSNKQTTIIHRDIKLENIFIHTVDGQDILKVGDFGFAREMGKNEQATTYLGSPFTQAPELTFYSKYDERADVYSLGIIFYQMLFGIYPFISFDPRNKAKKIAEQALILKLDLEKYGIVISEETKSLLNMMITFRPSDRINFQELFNFNYFKKNISDQYDMSLSNIFTKVKSIEIKQQEQRQSQQQQQLQQTQQYQQNQQQAVQQQKNQNQTKLLQNPEMQIEQNEFILRIQILANSYEYARKFSLKSQKILSNCLSEAQRLEVQGLKFKYNNISGLTQNQMQTFFIFDKCIIKLIFTSIDTKQLANQTKNQWGEQDVFIIIADLDDDEDDQDYQQNILKMITQCNNLIFENAKGKTLQNIDFSHDNKPSQDLNQNQKYLKKLFLIEDQLQAQIIQRESLNISDILNYCKDSGIDLQQIQAMQLFDQLSKQYYEIFTSFRKIVFQNQSLQNQSFQVQSDIYNKQDHRNKQEINKSGCC